MSSEPEHSYDHSHHAGNHADCFKHTVFCAVLKELQAVHPEGLLVADTHAGHGVYDLSNGQEHQSGIIKILQRYCSPQIDSIPTPVREYCRVCLETVGATNLDDFELYPGSPLLAQSLLRQTVDEHRLVDLYVEQVQGLDNFDDNPLNSPFRQIDAYDPATLDFLLPSEMNTKHPVVLIDAAYKDPDDYTQVKALLVRILERNPLATVLVWIPFIEGHRLRWSFATALRDVAKEHAKGGRYYANIVISKHDLQGSAMLVCNPTPLLDDVVDPTTLHWLAHVMNQGKDEYTVEQIMRKKKKQSANS